MAGLPGAGGRVALCGEGLGGEIVQGVTVFAEDEEQRPLALGEVGGPGEELKGEFGGVLGGFAGDAGGREQGRDPIPEPWARAGAAQPDAGEPRMGAVGGVDGPWRWGRFCFS